MLRSRLFQPNGKIRAQALVEFSLTAMVLVLLLMLIIEVARIFQTYVTLQSAVREGARYAVTGQWYAQYAGNQDDTGIAPMSSGWDPASGDALHHIAPCWPRFGPYTPVVSYPYTNPDPNVYEPYRDPRTCSIEATVIRGLTGLPLDPLNSGTTTTTSIGTFSICCYAAATKPYTYTITVFGYTDDMFPNNGEFGHPDPNDPTHWLVDDYSSINALAASSGAQPGLSPGYGGDPGQKVSVQIVYQFGLITPILSRIVSTFPMRAIATMTNETFGSTGVQSSAVLPPPLPALPALKDPTPPDLVINPIDFGVVGVPPNPAPNSDVTFNVAATNQLTGTNGETTLSDTAIRLYAIKSATQPTLPNPLNTPSQLTALGAIVLGPDALVPALMDPGTTMTPASITAQFTSGGDWWVYAFVDPDNIIDEAGAGLTTFDPTRENNNVTAPLHLIVTSNADLVLSKSVDNPAPAQNANVVYTINVTNLGGAAAPNASLTDLLPAGLTCLSANTPNYSCSTGIWAISTPTTPLGKGATAQLKITAKVTAAVGTTIQNTVTALTPDPSGGVLDPDHSNDLSCPAVSPNPPCYEADIIVGAINLSLTKTVTAPASGPIEGSANPFNFNLTVNNLTAATATGVYVTDSLPSGLTYVPPGSGSSTSAGCTISGSTVTCPVGTPSGTVNGNSSASATITVYVNSGQGGQTFTNTATVHSGLVDPDPSNDSSTVTVTSQSADIQVVKTVSPLYQAENNPFTWTVTVTNKGPNDDTNVKIQDVIPTASLAAAPTVNVSLGTWAAPTWTLPSLTNGQVATMTITASPKTGTVATTINNTASLSSANLTDTNTSNNSSTAGVIVSNATSADLSIVKTVSPTLAGPGTNVVYTFTATNNGPKPATGVLVTDTSLTNQFASGFMTYVSQAGTGTYNQVTGQSTTGQWNIGNLALGASVTKTVTVRVIGNSTTASFTNTASITGTLTDQDSTNNSDPATLNIAWPASIFVNPGGAGCVSDVWGATDAAVGINRTWVPSQTYVAGSWGLYGSNYTLQLPTSGLTFDDLNGNVVDSPTPPGPGTNLLGCTVTGTNFYYKFDGLLPGIYKITLLFTDPNNLPGTHRFGLDVITWRGRNNRILNNFDINNTIQNTPPKPLYRTGNQVTYYVVTYNYRVNNGGGNYLRLHFYNGRRTRTYTNILAMVSGIGITFVSP